MSENSSSSFFGAIKLFFVSLVGIAGIFKTCIRNSDEVADLARYSDEVLIGEDMARGASRMDDLRYGSRSTSLADLDVMNLSNAAVQERLALFEVRQLDALDESSFISKAWKSTDGLTPQMRLLSLQTELMPAPVRFAMAKPDGQELYSVLMGKTISRAESDAIFELFHIRVKPTEDYMSSYQLVTGNRPIASPYSPDNFEQIVKEGNSNQVYIRSIEKTSSVEDYVPPINKNTRRRETNIITEPPPPEANKSLIWKEIKILYKLSKLSKFKNNPEPNWNLIIFCPSSIDSIQKLYGFSQNESEQFTNTCKAWKKKYKIEVTASLSYIEKLCRSADKSMSWVILQPINEHIPIASSSAYYLCVKSNSTTTPANLVTISQWIDAMNSALQSGKKGSELFITSLPNAISDILISNKIERPVIIDLNNRTSYLTLN